MVSNLIQSGTRIFQKKQSNILSAAVVLMVAVLVSRLLGLVRDRMLAQFFYHEGSQWQLDVYFAAFRLPDMIFQLLVLGALSAAFIPVYSNFMAKKQQVAFDIARSIITLATVVFIAIGSVIFIYAEPLSRMISPNFNADEMSLMVDMTRIMIVAQLFFVASNFYTGILQSHQRFLVPAIAPILYNVGIIIGIWGLSSQFGIYGPAMGVVLGALMHLLIQVPLATHLGFRYWPKLDLQSKGVRKVIKLMIPRTLALAVTQIELTIAVYLASFLADGSLSIFYFAQHLQALPVGLFGLTIGQAALPILSKEEDNMKKFKVLFLSSFKQILYFVLPASVLLLVLRVPLVRIAFGASNFPWEATLMTGKVVAAFTISVAAQAVIQLLIRAFYALQDTVTPLIVGVITVLINVGFAWWFIKYLNMDVYGLALAISFASLIQAVLLFIVLNKKVKCFAVSEYVVPMFKMLIATSLMGIALWLPMRLLDQYVLNTAYTTELIILTIVASGIGFVVYILLSKFLQISEMDQLLAIVKKFGAWQKVLSQSEEALGETTASSTIPED